MEEYYDKLRQAHLLLGPGFKLIERDTSLEIRSDKVSIGVVFRDDLEGAIDDPSWFIVVLPPNRLEPTQMMCVCGPIPDPNFDAQLTKATQLIMASKG